MHVFGLFEETKSHMFSGKLGKTVHIGRQQPGHLSWRCLRPFWQNINNELGKNLGMTRYQDTGKNDQYLGNFFR